MKKKLLAVAVAGAFGLPGVALAQSSVTISGFFKGGLDNHKISNAAATRTGNKSETRVTDHSSRIIFNVVENIGGGLEAVGQFDLRFSTDATVRTQSTAGSGAASGSPDINPVSSGNNHVGLRSKTWGSIRFGRQDTHYGNSGDIGPVSKLALWAFNASTFDGVMRPGSSVVAIANWSRTPNLIWYDSPRWGIFNFTIGYSTNPLRVSGTNEAENDLGRTGRKGRGWTLNPRLEGQNWHLSWSFWDAKADWTGCPAGSGDAASVVAFTEACANGNDDQRANTIRGHYIWGGLRVGLAWNHSKTYTPVTRVLTGDRKAWSLPVVYTMGPHNFYGTYTHVGDSKDTAGGSGANTGARQIMLGYAYDLSNRTSVSLTYVKLNNDSAARYGLFYVSENVMGGTVAQTLAPGGEDHRMMGVTLRHSF